MVVRYDNGTGGGRTDFDRPLSFMRIGVDIHREFEETAAFRSLVAKRETSSLCKWERRLLRITTCDTRRGRGWGASSVSEAWRSGCGENPISSLLSFLPSCEWHKSPKINLSVEWKASWGASDWTSIIYGISRGWHHGSFMPRGRSIALSL